MLVEQLRIEERQLDRVTDRLDLTLEPPDVLVTDIRDLLEHELLDLFLRQELGDHHRPRVEQHVVAGTHRVLEEVPGEVRDVDLVAATEDKRPVVAETILHLDDFAGAIRIQDLHRVQRLVEDDLRTRDDLHDFDVRRGHHPHLAACGHDVERPVVVGPEEDAERRGRLAELLDLFGERLDLVPLVAQRVGELLVLTHRLGELLARLDELLLEDGDLARRVGQPAAQEPDLFLQELDLGSQLVDLLTVSGHLRLLRAFRIYTCGPTRSWNAPVWSVLLSIYGTSRRMA